MWLYGSEGVARWYPDIKKTRPALETHGRAGTGINPEPNLSPWNGASTMNPSPTVPQDTDRKAILDEEVYEVDTPTLLRADLTPAVARELHRRIGGLGRMSYRYMYGGL